MRAIVDRVEDDVAVVIFEDGGRAYLPAAQLPPGAGEGTVLTVTWAVETGTSAQEAAELIDRLRRHGEEHL